jgi:hypothetical protein
MRGWGGSQHDLVLTMLKLVILFDYHPSKIWAQLVILSIQLKARNVSVVQRK